MNNDDIKIKIKEAKRIVSDAFDQVRQALDEIPWPAHASAFNTSKGRLLCEADNLHNDIDYLLGEAVDGYDFFRVVIPYDSVNGDRFSYYVNNRIITFETLNRKGNVCTKNIREIPMLPSMTVDDLVCIEDKEKKTMVITLKN